MLKKRIRLSTIIRIILIVAALLVPCLHLKKYIMRILITAGIYMILGMSLNLVMGIGGMVSLGQAVFYGIGAYSAALITLRLCWPLWSVILATIVISGLSGFLLSIPMGRVTGRYVAIITLGYCEIINLILINWQSLTRGPAGLMNIPRPVTLGYQLKSSNSYYYFVLATVFIVYTAIGWTLNSKLGRNLRAMKEDSIAAEAMGINIFRQKMIVFTMSGAVGGIAGMLYAFNIGYIDPTNFTNVESLAVVSIVTVGGLGSMFGTIIASFVLTVIPEMLRGFSEYRQVLYGAALVLIVLLDHSIPGTRFKRYLSDQTDKVKSKFLQKIAKMERKGKNDSAVRS